MLCGNFAESDVEGEGQIESDRLSQHTAASRDPIWNAAYEPKSCTHAW